MIELKHDETSKDNIMRMIDLWAFVHALQGIQPSYNVRGHKYDDGQHAYRHCIEEVH